MNQMLGKIDGVDFWLVTSLIIFGVFFLGVLARLAFLRKNQAEYLKNIPFTETEN